MLGPQNQRQHLLIPEQPRLLRHHELLGAGILDSFNGERAHPPLAEAAFVHTSIAWRRVAPEEDEFERLAGIVRLS
ncbi:hypothetical protein D3C72_2471190 [compost metagenome]